MSEQLTTSDPTDADTAAAETSVEEQGNVEAAPDATSDDSSGPGRRGGRVAALEREGDVAADYLEALLDIIDVDGDIDMDVEGDRAMVSIVGGDLDELVGSGGDVLDALQDLTRLAVTRETGERSRLMLDIAGFRAARRAELATLGAAAAEEASRTGSRVKLAPMTPFERKVVHDAVAAAGLTSESEGAEPQRCVVVIPA